MEVANNSTINITAVAYVTLTVNNIRKQIDMFLVPSLGYECILKMDFLHKFDIIIDFGKEKWKIKDRRFQVFVYGTTSQSIK